MSARKIIEAAGTQSQNIQFAYAQAELKKLGITLRRTPEGEYAVRRLGSPSGEGYYATDLEDALATGKEMAKDPDSNSPDWTIRMRT